MYLIRQYRRDGKLAIALTPERGLRARHPEVNRPAKHQPFPQLGRLVEGTGKHRKDVVDLTLDPNATEDQRGRRAADRYVRVHLNDVSATVRRLYNEFCEPLQLNATAIAKAQAEVERLRDERAELVRSAWRKGRKSVGARELEEKVERTKEVDATPAKALVLSDEDREQLKRDQQTLNAFARKALGG